VLTYYVKFEVSVLKLKGQNSTAPAAIVSYGVIKIINTTLGKYNCLWYKNLIETHGRLELSNCSIEDRNSWSGSDTDRSAFYNPDDVGYTGTEPAGIYISSGTYTGIDSLSAHPPLCSGEKIEITGGTFNYFDPTPYVDTDIYDVNKTGTSYTVTLKQ